MTDALPGVVFFVLLGTVLLGASAAYAAGVLHSASWDEVRRLDAVFPFYEWHIREFTAADLAQTWHNLALGAAVLATVTAALACTRTGQAEIKTSAGEVQGALTALTQPFRKLPTTQKKVIWCSFTALTALRVVLSFPSITPEYDDAASYTLFVSKGLLAVGSYYPLPNNHVLSNVVSWLFSLVSANFWWTMRLPVVLAATAATALLFLGLLRERMGFRPALVATGLFCMAQLSVYHAAVGRGYWLLTGFAGVVFFAMLALVAGTARPRAAWLGLVVAGVLGAYTVPTFALVLASAFSWLAIKFMSTRSWANGCRLLATGIVVAGGILALYAPLLFVSGASIFFGNGFVLPQHQSLAAYAAGLPLYLWQTEGFLVGQTTLGALLTLAGLAAAGLVHRQLSRLPLAIAEPWLRLVPAALWFTALPYALILAQRVFAPGRILLYKAFFFFVILALVVEWLLRRQPARAQRWLRPALAAAAVLWTAYQGNCLWRDNRTPRQHNAAYHAAYQWLAAQPRGAVLVPEPTHSIFLRLYFLAEQPHAPWRLDGRPVPGQAYCYVVAFPNQRGAFQPTFPVAPTFHNAEVDIYRVPATMPPAGPAGLPPYWRMVN